MGKPTTRVSVGISMLILAVLACQPGPAPAPTFIVTVQPITPPPSTLPFQTATPVILEATVPATFTLEATGLPTFTPTDTLIPSPTIPLVSVSAATNCRTGPGRAYDRVLVVDVGITYEVIGKNTLDNYWVIKMPNGGQCWLWGQYASTVGDVNDLPEMVPPPTPTPAFGAVNGLITDLAGKKVSGVLVTAQLSKRTSTTDSNGTYLIGNLPAGQEFITIEDGSHRPKFRSVNISAGHTVTADFVFDPNLYDRLVTAASGLVLLNSEPAAGVNVQVWAKNASAVTDSNGRYRIEFVDPGYIRNTTLLILAESGNLRGAVEWNPFQMTTVPDIILLPR